MVAKSSTMQATKRKKTDDMADSPPKRVTRARAMKTTEDLGLVAKPATTRKTARKATTKPSESKKAPLIKSTTPSSNTSASGGVKKYRLRADETKGNDPNREGLEGSEAQADLQTRSTGSRCGGTKAAKKVENQSIEPAEQAPTRGLRTRAATAKQTLKRPTSSATNQKKSPVEIHGVKASEEALPKMPARPMGTATRAEQAPTRTRAPTGKTTSNKPVTKKVKFQEDTDKENLPLATTSSAKSATRATGLKAKPVRKPPVPRANTRARKTLQQKEDNPADQEPKKPLPLSPKKIHQVAKADSASSEDELAGDEMLTASPKRSPAKQRSTPMHTATQLQESANMTSEASASPSKPLSVTGLTSPAKRPPQPPFRDGLAVSPKRVGLDFSPSKPVMQVTLSKSPAKSMLLQESPRKGKLPSSPAKSTFNGPFSPLKRSILQSPARRPPSSPFKSLPPIYAHPSLPNHNSKTMLNELPEQQLNIHVPDPFQVVRDPQGSLSFHQLSPETPNAPSTIKNFSSDAQQGPAENETPQSLRSDDLDQASKMDCDVQETEMIDTHEADAADPRPIAFYVKDSALRRVSMESDSTDELASPDKKYAPTPLRKYGSMALDFATPSDAVGAKSVKQNVSFTPLLRKLNGWAASTPLKQGSAQAVYQDQIFSLENNTINSPLITQDASRDAVASQAASPAKSTFFEDEMAVRDDFKDQASMLENDLELLEKEKCLPGAVAPEFAQPVHESFSSDEYGDENAVPSIAEVIREEQDAQVRTPTCTPAKVFTPVKKPTLRSQEVHTVSKVPLRASAEESPFKLPRQRSRSFGGALAVLPESQPKFCQTSEGSMDEVIDGGSPALKVAGPASPQTPISSMRLNAETPGRTVRKGVVPDVLKGAVVFVDVHTSEGADASGIFVDLLTQMGARCVKQWNWNPRASLGDSLDSAALMTKDSDKPALPVGKIGITHVVFKDGSKRTLEKVRASNSVVLCVGVGWVLDCEREDRWLDETNYSIDTTLVPRGGGRRRKSMEPRALANLGGNLVPANPSTTNVSEAATPNAQDGISPTQEFLTFDTPASRRDTFIIERKPLVPEDNEPVGELQHQSDDAARLAPLSTPVIDLNTLGGDYVDEYDEDSMNSPTTPYYLSKGAQLVQRTCPPKRLGYAPGLHGGVGGGGGGLFPVSGRIEDVADEGVRRRLVEARRKSLQWASKTKSPLGRTVSYGR